MNVVKPEQKIDYVESYPAFDVTKVELSPKTLIIKRVLVNYPAMMILGANSAKKEYQSKSPVDKIVYIVANASEDSKYKEGDRLIINGHTLNESNYLLDVDNPHSIENISKALNELTRSLNKQEVHQFSNDNRQTKYNIVEYYVINDIDVFGKVL